MDIMSVFLTGRLVRNAELKYTSTGYPCCKFSLAANKKKKKGEEYIDTVHFFDVVLWGRSGEALERYLVQGKEVVISGDLDQSRWTEAGVNKNKISVIARSIKLCGGNPTNEKAGNPGAVEEGIQADGDAIPPDFPDDIPF